MTRLASPATRHILVWLTGAALLLGGCSHNDSVYTGNFEAFGSLVDVTIVGIPIEKSQDAVRLLEQDFAFMQEAWNPARPGPLTLTNHMLLEGSPFSAPPSILPLVNLAREYAKVSDGMLNPAQGNLVRLWGFYDVNCEDFRPPDEHAIANTLAGTPRMDDLEIDGFVVRTSNSQVALDFDSFVHGYAIDESIRRLREMGIEDALINVGGDVRAIGSRAGHPWNVPIRRSDGTGVLATLDVSGDRSIVTVGESERFLTWKGIHYHAILDPRTGYPAEGTRSVTVVHQDAATAEAAANALFIAGPEHWPVVAHRMGVEEVILVDDEGVLHMTPALHGRLRFLEKPKKIRTVQPAGDANPAT
ncbi:MAG: FAD:protein FMN transferase [Pseudomonadota bacterium]